MNVSETDHVTAIARVSGGNKKKAARGISEGQGNLLQQAPDPMKVKEVPDDLMETEDEDLMAEEFEDAEDAEATEADE
jgi:hypothetical protein